MKFITGSDFNNTRISCQENLDLWILLFASGELVSLFCTLSLILRSQCCRDQKPRKDLFQIKKSFWNGSLINMQELCRPWIQPIKILQSYVKEPVALKVSVRERKIRLFLPRRKNLFNPYLLKKQRNICQHNYTLFNCSVWHHTEYALHGVLLHEVGSKFIFQLDLSTNIFTENASYI